MAEAKKKVGVAYWATVVVVVGLLYIASFGPACWLTSRTGNGKNALPIMYRPVMRLMSIDDSPAELKRRVTPPSPTPFPGRFRIYATYFYPQGAASKYACLWAAKDWKWRFVANVEYAPDPLVRMDQGHWEWCNSSKK
jgi:hypothetical protein